MINQHGLQGKYFKFWFLNNLQRSSLNYTFFKFG